jgi:phospholipase/carboxylesterase
MSLEAISIPPSNGETPQKIIVLSHGWGANYQDLVPLTSMFELPDYQFLFPNAPFSHPEVPGGRAWYGLEDPSYPGIEESRKTFYNWLVSLPEETGISLENTIVAGFSQGGAMSLDIGLKLPVAAVCSLSGYLHFEPEKQAQPFPPVLMFHGKFDPVVPLNLAQLGKKKLESVGVNLTYQEFNIGHEINAQEISLMRQFILALFSS